MTYNLSSGTLNYTILYYTILYYIILYYTLTGTSNAGRLRKSWFSTNISLYL